MSMLLLSTHYIYFLYTIATILQNVLGYTCYFFLLFFGYVGHMTPPKSSIQLLNITSRMLAPTWLIPWCSTLVVKSKCNKIAKVFKVNLMENLLH